ncbi:LUD domain-containing protein, partial [Luoshenia tenuis]
MNEILQTTADNLNARGFDAQIFNTADEVKRAVMDFIGEGKTVGIGGSVTVRELGLYEALKDKGNDVAWHWEV